MASIGLPTLRAGTPVKGEGGLRGISPEYNYATRRWERVGGEYAEGLGGGCTSGKYVCNRLIEVRKRYGA